MTFISYPGTHVINGGEFLQNHHVMNHRGGTLAEAKRTIMSCCSINRQSALQIARDDHLQVRPAMKTPTHNRDPNRIETATA